MLQYSICHTYMHIRMTQTNNRSICTIYVDEHETRLLNVGFLAYNKVILLPPVIRENQTTL